MIKTSSLAVVFISLLASAQAQNWTTVTASNITDLNQQKLAAGSLCFLGTDQNDSPIGFQVGGGGQVLARPFCVAIANGASAALNVPNPQNTQPQGISYRVTATDTSTGQTVLRYAGVSFSGGSFNLDQYAPQYPGFATAPTATSTSGNFTVNGNLTVTGSVSGSYVAASSPFSGLSGSAAAGSFENVSDKLRGLYLMNGIGAWVPASPFANLKNWAKGDIVVLNAGCSTTSGSFTVTCSGANFTSADSGKLIVIYGAKSNGSGAAASATLAGGQLQTPTITTAGSGYVNPPSIGVSGLTCTYSPELKAGIASGAVNSVSVVYAGSGCTGTPAISFSNPNLAWSGTINAVASGTQITVASAAMGAPGVTAGGLTSVYASDDGAALNSAIDTLAVKSDLALNPVPIFCDRVFMSSQTIQFVNKSVRFLGVPGGNIGSANNAAPQGCGFLYTGGPGTDAVYIAGNVFSEFSGVHVLGVSGGKARAAIRLQQPGGGVTSHANQYNIFRDIVAGPWFVGEPDILSAPNGEFQYGIFFDQPNTNNDQMAFSNVLINGADIGVYQYANQSTELLFDRLACDFCGYGVKLTSQMIGRDWDISNSQNCDIQLADVAYNNTNLSLMLDLSYFTSEGSHQFLCADAQQGAVNNVSLFLHGRIGFQVGSGTAKNGRIVDLTALQWAPNLSVTTDEAITSTGILPASTAPLNFAWAPNGGQASGANFVQNGAAIAGNVADSPMSSFANLQLTYPDARHSQWFKRDWFVGFNGAGHRCHTDQIYFGGSPDNLECNNTTVLGKERVVGAVLVNQLGAPSAPVCSVLTGSGATTYFYKMSALVAGVSTAASAEASCAGQNASLSASAQNQFCAIPVAGAQQYAVYESTTTGQEKLLATVNADNMAPAGANLVCYNDAAGGAAGALAPTLDAGTGGEYLQGPLQIGGGSTIRKHLSMTASLTPSAPGTVPGCSADLSTSLSGAAVGDTIALGIPGSAVASQQAFAWVDSGNTVKIRWCQFSGTAAAPVAGTYRVDDWQH